MIKYDDEVILNDWTDIPSVSSEYVTKIMFHVHALVRVTELSLAKVYSGFDIHRVSTKCARMKYYDKTVLEEYRIGGTTVAQIYVQHDERTQDAKVSVSGTDKFMKEMEQFNNVVAG